MDKDIASVLRLIADALDENGTNVANVLALDVCAQAARRAFREGVPSGCWTDEQVRRQIATAESYLDPIYQILD
jgi:hypothetical protein